LAPRAKRTAIATCSALPELDPRAVVERARGRLAVAFASRVRVAEREAVLPGGFGTFEPAVLERRVGVVAANPVSAPTVDDYPYAHGKRSRSRRLASRPVRAEPTHERREILAARRCGSRRDALAPQASELVRDCAHRGQRFACLDPEQCQGGPAHQKCVAVHIGGQRIALEPLREGRGGAVHRCEIRSSDRHAEPGLVIDADGHAASWAGRFPALGARRLGRGHARERRARRLGQRAGFEVACTDQQHASRAKVLRQKRAHPLRAHLGVVLSAAKGAQPSHRFAVKRL
jgi:hypothetical protein